ncbi:MAG TPA: alkaline phosphatase family protein [Alphaproteobacteria bacterium]|nr:alkaline phosphatase family protein [Alphaproteobacteria bacterium]
MIKSFTLTALFVTIAGIAAAHAPVSPAASGAPTASATQKSTSDRAPEFKRVMTIILENTNYEAALKQPFLSSLATRGAVLTRFGAEAHPSQPNYIALVSGSTHGVDSDANVNLDVKHIGDLLETKGRQWKVYAEDYPGNCFLGARSQGYVRKHLPFLSFKDVQTKPERCARIVNADQLSRDIQSGNLPDYSLYIPNLDNDGHDTGVNYADRWLSKRFGPLLNNAAFTKGLLLIVTFDETDLDEQTPPSNHILTVLIGDSVQPGSKSDRLYDHYSLLRLVEDRFDLGHLTANDAGAAPIAGIWK